ncbi:hypothetical protein [Pseudoteredinibacter isoporae]|uniref:Uncharacterized protein n=1 Tax=Pseudoteredinibacter isoporae TaxID=570281 RepID=A0A7X0MVL9_9GAMM|nr:hypothetical protein [Pseudoteredinibacter isoporae]MBB6521851.1 hypothetical protein [Pseudoteredinibacter isoporae]NHO87395.1 hypothetical protein [Pseudoteredinibacter isoporae]NIB22510.1 hypothetical protein [Pseudoteredinibacter isoporae]
MLKMIIDHSVAGEESLGLANLFETPHLPFLLSGFLMGNLSNIVMILCGGMLHFAAQVP